MLQTIYKNSFIFISSIFFLAFLIPFLTQANSGGCFMTTAPELITLCQGGVCTDSFAMQYERTGDTCKDAFARVILDELPPYEQQSFSAALQDAQSTMQDGIYRISGGWGCLEEYPCFQKGSVIFEQLSTTATSEEFERIKKNFGTGGFKNKIKDIASSLIFYYIGLFLLIIWPWVLCRKTSSLRKYRPLFILIGVVVQIIVVLIYPKPPYIGLDIEPHYIPYAILQFSIVITALYLLLSGIKSMIKSKK